MLRSVLVALGTAACLFAFAGLGELPGGTVARAVASVAMGLAVTDEDGSAVVLNVHPLVEIKRQRIRALHPRDELAVRRRQREHRAQPTAICLKAAVGPEERQREPAAVAPGEHR